MRTPPSSSPPPLRLSYPLPPPTRRPRCQRAARYLNVTAAAGRQNTVGVGLSGAVYKVRDSGDMVAAGPGCVAVDLHTATCAAAGLTRTSIDVGDLDDTVVKDAWSLGGTIDGGQWRRHDQRRAGELGQPPARRPG